MHFLTFSTSGGKNNVTKNTQKPTLATRRLRSSGTFTLNEQRENGRWWNLNIRRIRLALLGERGRLSQHIQDDAFLALFSYFLRMWHHRIPKKVFHRYGNIEPRNLPLSFSMNLRVKWKTQRRNESPPTARDVDKKTLRERSADKRHVEVRKCFEAPTIFLIQPTEIFFFSPFVRFPLVFCLFRQLGLSTKQIKRRREQEIRKTFLSSFPSKERSSA